MTIIPNPATPDDLSAAFQGEYDAIRQAVASGKPRGPITGFPELDKQLGGYLIPGIHTFLAAPGAGKTAYCTQIGAQCRCPCLYVTAEMRPVEIYRRCVARVTSTDIGDLRSGLLSAQKIAELSRRTNAAMPQFVIHDATSRNPMNPKATNSPKPYTKEALAIAATNLKEAHDTNHILIVLDSFTGFVNKNNVSGENEYAITETVLGEIEELAFDLMCPIIAIVHRHRDGNKKTGENQLFSGKASGRIEYVSESLWIIEKVNELTANGAFKRELTLHKNRNGAGDVTIEYGFTGRHQSFEEGLIKASLK